nr:MAG TPA: hypothetical protein [Caudoviricetes sp.]
MKTSVGSPKKRQRSALFGKKEQHPRKSEMFYFIKREQEGVL